MIHQGIGFFPLFYLLAIHYIGDFIAQDDATARGKSKNIGILSYHICIYTFILFVCFSPISLHKAAIFAVVNGLLHFIIDFFTSKLTSKFFGKGDYHNGFLVVGADQILHIFCLVMTYRYIYII